MAAASGTVLPGAAEAQEVLPFPPKPSGSTASRTMQESVYSPRPAAAAAAGRRAQHPHRPDRRRRTGACRPPSAARSTRRRWIASPRGGISYNRFHTTAMCSPTRAALLTGRNHHRVGNGQIAELANDWDGYSRRHPEEQRHRRRGAEGLRLRHRRVRQVAQHAGRTRPPPPGPFEYWPTGYGFEYFYGFLAGEASQYEPNLVRNTTVVHPNPHAPGKSYHLSEDLADDAIDWLRKHKAFQPDKPFFMYWAQRRHPRPAPRHEGVGRQVQGQVRRRLGQVPRARLRARQGNGLDSAERAAHAAAGIAGRPGTASRRTKSPSSAA